MEKRKILVNKKERDVSLLGFGCMRFPTKDGEIDVAESKKMVDYAIEHDVNYIDTAWPYHNGKSELVVREFMKNYSRDSYFLADKLPLCEIKTNEDVDRIFHEQLEKCGVEYFDFYLIHAVNKQRYDQAIELNLLSKECIQPILNLIIEIQKMNYSFQKSIVNKISILNTQI